MRAVPRPAHLLGLAAQASLLAFGCAARPVDLMVTKPSAAPETEVANTDAWRFTEPHVSAPPPKALPTPVTFSLDNGIAVVVQPQPRLPLFAAAMMFGGGSERDPVGKEGLAAACLAAWLPENATMQGELVSGLLADIGVGMAASAGDNYSLITLRGPSWNLQRALELWQQVALPPSWQSDRAEMLARAKARLALVLRKATTDPEAIASRMLRHAVLGASAAPAPTVESLARITATDCEAYQARHLRADQLTIIVAGDVDVAHVRLELQRANQVRSTSFTDLPRRPSAPNVAAKAFTPPASNAPAPLTITLLHVPAASQSQIAIGQVGVAPSHAAYVSTLVAMQALGGAGGGRLVSKLRETTGFGYYAKYSATTGPARSLFGLHASVEPGAAWLAATYMLHERNKLVRGMPVAHGELASIVANRTQLAYEAFATPQAWVMAYVQVARLGLNMNFLPIARTRRANARCGARRHANAGEPAA
ncbi:MAG: insulinase family protein [Myxococcales bacterium]|nr:insulinase family protein [Myxococcales bacterium]